MDIAVHCTQSPKVNCSDLSSQKNGTATSNHLPDLLMSCFTMTFGTISNLTALGILAKSRARFRRQSKAPFFHLTVALLLADLGGHLILGAFALHMHVKKKWTTTTNNNINFCPFFGASMVFFGLCSLLIGCAMAVERCVAITQPFYHISTITVAHAQGMVLLLCSVACTLALLPVFGVGNYSIQFPGTWCFLQIHEPQTAADKNLVMTFSCLGLTALTVSLLCNILSGLVLLQARRKSCSSANTSTRFARRGSSASSSSLFCSLDMEMIVQLAVITVVSCICWGPFLVHITNIQHKSSPRLSADIKDGFTLLALRMAAWNQILDPWVYILLRKTVLSRVFRGFYFQRTTMSANSYSVEYQREVFRLH
uniref:Thromboxane A2 receptor n=1 Tax=Oryzias sinensis TaxID=183150 RepID=A0A8C7YQU6_9TELE